MNKRLVFCILVIIIIFLPLHSYSDSGKSILLKIGSRTAYVNFQQVTLDVAPIEIKGRTLVPLRFIAEHFGAKKIEYYADTEEILILLDDQTALQEEISRLRNENDYLREKIRQLEGQEPSPSPRIQKPGQPQNLQCSLVNQNVLLTWQPSDPGTFPVGGYRIYKDEICFKDYTRIATTDATTTSFTDTEVVEGKTYTYYITAIDAQNPPNESLESQVKFIYIPPSRNPHPPSEPSPGKYQHQFTFPDLHYPYNIKDVHIAEDAHYLYFRYSTYRSWKNATNFDIVTWIDIDQNIHTGLKAENGYPIGYEYAVGFFYNDAGEFIGAVTKINEATNKMTLSYLFYEDEYTMEANSISFALSKQFLIENHPFDYNLMIVYDNDAHETEFYPPTTKLTYPKSTPGFTGKIDQRIIDELKKLYHRASKENDPLSHPF